MTARITATHNNVVLVSSEFPMQTLNAYTSDYHAIRARQRRRRRRRYLKKRRLTEEEVNHLFPKRTYQNWLNGGAEEDAQNRDIGLVLKEENDEELHQQEQEQEQQHSQEVENEEGHEHNVSETNNDSTEVGDEIDTHEHEHNHHHVELDLGSPFHEEIHFDSGSCAICIEVFENDDIVRGLICGHVFHQECLDPWLIKRKACCPMCKRDYYMKNTGDQTQSDNEENNNNNNNNDNNDLDSLNQFPDLEYTTITERVAEILRTNPEYEAIAKEKIKKYMNFRWRVFWVVMGISKEDLLNSAIVDEDHRARTRTTEESSNNQPTNENNNQQQQQQHTDHVTEPEADERARAMV
ncbi:hypothetical protein WICMUC_001773 [Wickerhamomyces mucosus]|uniref:RING-type domain-containing protein n=1 Tax=Wickerhamomyces mucosus TaxID=1378264 RepID=A0A9P8PRW6_9ASCO|nr:hypothetical protein WICMUC_001773 [Wickerhamomyces mucosus]